MSIHDRPAQLWEIYNKAKERGLEPRWVHDHLIEFKCPCCGDRATAWAAEDGKVTLNGEEVPS